MGRRNARRTAIWGGITAGALSAFAWLISWPWHNEPGSAGSEVVPEMMRSNSGGHNMARTMTPRQAQEVAPPRAKTLPEDDARVIAHVDALAKEVRASRDNIFVDVDFILQRALALNEAVVEDLFQTLQEPPEIDSFQETPNISEDKILARMSMIDLLEAFARYKITEDSASGAINALEKMILAGLPNNLDQLQTSVMVAEKYDALVGLSRLDPRLGAGALMQVHPAEAREVLYPALLTGLVDRGVARDDVQGFALRLFDGS